VTLVDLLLLFMTISFFGTLTVWAYDIVERHLTKEDQP
jgi:hypothetical protein